MDIEFIGKQQSITKKLKRNFSQYTLFMDYLYYLLYQYFNLTLSKYYGTMNVFIKKEIYNEKII